MEIIRAKKMGFCFGVKEAINRCIEVADKIKEGKKIYILGMLVHNEHVVEAMKELGLKMLEESDLITGKDSLEDGDIVIIRAHGTTKEIYEILEKRKVEIKDATCIFVKDIRQKLVKLENDQKKIIFIGDKEHPEVKGILSFGKNVSVFDGMPELESKEESLNTTTEYSLLTQTTLNKDKIKEIKNYLENRKLNVNIYNKICSATQERQEAVEELAKKVDFVLIVGGKNSSNTKKLYEIAKKYNANTQLINSEEELDINWFKKIATVGISAGASTPEEVIIKIENKIRGLKING
ncbi:MAG: 4-hydroxy-3-methylbut-2-enyl diphosphate reductase [Fusobacteriaceae bacterium]